MGAPAIDWLCGNGHHVSSTPHHGFDCFNETKCPFCDSTKFTCIVEWGDPDYGEEVISTKPIRYDKADQVDKYGNHYFVDIAVYDVSRCQFS